MWKQDEHQCRVYMMMFILTEDVISSEIWWTIHGREIFIKDDMGWFNGGLFFKIEYYEVFPLLSISKKKSIISLHQTYQVVQNQLTQIKSKHMKVIYV